MRPLINKDDSLIKEYLEIREKILNIINTDSSIEDYYRSHQESILDRGGMDVMASAIDELITDSKLSDMGKKLLRGYNPILEIVDHDYVLGSRDEMCRTYSFKTIEELNKKVIELKKDDEDYDPFDRDYGNLKIETRAGTLEDNYDWFVKKYEKGWTFFIKADSVYSDKLKIAYIKY